MRFGTRRNPAGGWPPIILLFSLIAGCAEMRVNEPYKREPSKPAEVLVVYYSRSGNTEAMAQEIARRLGADLTRLEASSYPLTFRGYLAASWDALLRRPAGIEPKRMDLSRYKQVFLGAPVWYWRAAPPLESFIDRNDFRGVETVIFLSLESSYSEEAVAELGKLVEKRGGKYLGHFVVKRKGIGPDEVSAETGRLVEEGEYIR